ncbi:MAG: tetratricopeptide repeat protein [Candidatus Eisenbacteria bacterium]|uniref:Tetratricopeptide repeat protein n=1 Tax=Eiseniibacteriota bacterium TaxID=2212470 RepID=A0A956LWM6_UNCEI|nr:tetratricopeptide repeat protein [Candidatus Eisenbacteria bacterium]
MQAKSDGNKTGPRKRSAARRSAGVPFSLIVIGLLILGSRLAIVHALSGSPVFVQPTLTDAGYQQQMVRMHTPIGANVDLPRGSLLYPRLGSLVPGAGSGDPGRLRYLQGLLDALSGLLIALFIHRRVGAIAGIATGVLYLLDPLGGFFAARLLPTTFATLVLAASLFSIERARDRVGPLWQVALLGLLLGIGFLFEPLLFTLLAIVTGWQLARDTARSRSSTLGRLGTMAAPLLAALVLTLVHNAGLRAGGPAISWGSGYTAYQAVLPETGGTPRYLEPPSWESESATRSRVWEALGREGTTYDVYRFYATRAFQQVLEHPVALIGVLLTKAAATIGSWPVPDALSPAFLFARQVPFARHGSFSFAILAGLAAAGWWMAQRVKHGTDEPPAWLGPLQTGLVAVGLTCLLGTTSAASRQPALPLLAGLGGVWIGAAIDASRRRAALAGSTVGVLVGAALISIVAGLLAPTSKLRNPSEDLRLIATNFVMSSNWRQAIPTLEASVRADSLNLESRTMLARAYQNDGLVGAAEEQLELAHAADSTHVGSLLQLSALAMTQGDPARAVALMNAVVTQHPNNPLFLNELGQLLLRTGNVAGAQTLFTRALEIKPDYRVASDNLQVVESMLQHAEQQIYPSEMRLPPDDPIGLTVPQIVSAMDRADWAQADSLITLAEEQRGDIVLPHWLRAAYYARQGQLTPAIQSLETCQKLAPCRPAIVDLLASLLLQSGQKERGLRLVQDCARDVAGDPAREEPFRKILEGLQAASTDSNAEGTGP